MEQYYEQNVTNKDIDRRAKRTKSLNIARSVCFVLGVAPLIMTAMFILGEMLFMVFVLIGIAVPFFVAAIVIGYFNKRNNTEYDYVIDSEKLTVTEVYYRESRKVKYSIPLRAIESVGAFDSEKYKKLQGNAVKKSLAIVNYDDEKSIVYIYYYTEKGRKILFIEPDRGFIIALKRSVSALTVFDESMNELIKLLEEREAQENDLS
ncbi:MAG: hypothetical protein J1F39_00330 [Clostridiales bacterium]|nr:hypothetical protein [Clostridiales bacterium]